MSHVTHLRRKETSYRTYCYGAVVLICNSDNLRYSVERLTPRRRAASMRLPFDAASAASIRLRSSFPSIAGSESSGLISGGRSWGRMTVPVHRRATACSPQSVGSRSGHKNASGPGAGGSPLLSCHAGAAPSHLPRRRLAARTIYCTRRESDSASTAGPTPGGYRGKRDTISPI